MATTREELIPIIVEKLTDLEIAGEAAFGEVFDYPNGDFKNYPVAVVRVTGFEGRVLDTHRNERTFHFVIDMYQEQSVAGKDKESANEIMVKLSDAVMQAFDTDPDLGGSVEIVRVVRAIDDFKQSAGTFNFETIEVDCVVVLQNY